MWIGRFQLDKPNKTKQINYLLSLINSKTIRKVYTIFYLGSVHGAHHKKQKKNKKNQFESTSPTTSTNNLTSSNLCVKSFLNACLFIDGYIQGRKVKALCWPKINEFLGVIVLGLHNALGSNAKTHVFIWTWSKVLTLLTHTHSHYRHNFYATTPFFLELPWFVSLFLRVHKSMASQHLCLMKLVERNFLKLQQYLDLLKLY